MTDTLRVLREATAELVQDQHEEIAALIRKGQCAGVTQVVISADEVATELSVTTHFIVPGQVH